MPLPIGNGEQALNAPVVDAGGGLMVADAALTPMGDRDRPRSATDAERLASMSKAATLVIPRDADDKLAEMILGAPAAAGSHR